MSPYDEGWHTAKAGDSSWENPYVSGTPNYEAWEEGYLSYGQDLNEDEYDIYGGEA